MVKQNRRATLAVKNNTDDDSAQITFHASEEFDGPIHSPDVLNSYGKIDPSFPHRILELTEKEQKFRHHYMKDALNGTINTIRIGQIFAFILCLLILCLAAYLVYKDHPTTAAILATLDLVGLAAAFLSSKDNDKKD